MLENVSGNFTSTSLPLPNLSCSDTQLRRIRAVTNTHRELPSVDMGHSVDDFFEDLEKTSNEGKKLPNWHGELYLEVCLTFSCTLSQC
jgi:alpha-mannosidase